VDFYWALLWWRLPAARRSKAPVLDDIVSFIASAD
jgi:hypothetical protein